MNKLPLSFYVDSILNIDAQLKKTETELNAIFEMDTDRRKVIELIRVAADLQIELEFIKDGMENEVALRSRKKFWQFWK